MKEVEEEPRVPPVPNLPLHLCALVSRELARADSTNAFKPARFWNARNNKLIRKLLDTPLLLFHY